MTSLEDINSIQIKVLLARLVGRVEQQSRREESMVGSTNSKGGDLKAVDDSASSLKSSPKSCPASSNTDDKKLPKPAAFDNEVQSPPPILTPSLPFTLYDNDDCDEVEKLARAKRIEVILRLSAEAKAKEAEKKRVASIRPLTWAEPTFHHPSSSSNSSATTAASEVPRPATPGKRKERQDESTNNYHRFNYPRQPTEEEAQALLDVMDKWFPSSKRKRTDMDGDNNN